MVRCSVNRTGLLRIRGRHTGEITATFWCHRRTTTVEWPPARLMFSCSFVLLIIMAYWLWMYTVSHKHNSDDSLYKVKKCPIHCEECRQGVHLPFLGIESAVQCNVRPTVTFPTAGHYRPLNGTKLYCLVAKAHTCKQLTQGCHLKPKARSRTRDLQSCMSNALPITPPGHRSILSVALLNFEHFSYFFHWQTQQYVCNRIMLCKV